MAQPYAFLNDLDLDQDVVSRLSQSLRRVEEGNDQVYTTPLAKEESPDVILAKWDKVFQAKQDNLEPELRDLELLNKEKFGPRSLALPWPEREESLDNYFKPETLESGPEFVVPKGGNLRPVSQKRALMNLKNNTSSGLPDLKKKSLVKDRLDRQTAKYLRRQDPCVLFTRTQEYDSSSRRSKTRNVWGYPIADTLLEMTIYLPLLEYMKRKPWRAALLGPTAVDSGVSRLFDYARRGGMYLVSIDFDAYDASVKSKLQDAVKTFIKALFQKSAYETIDYVFGRFGTIGIVTPSGVKVGQHGIPSGSTFTNEADSIAQYVVSESLKLQAQIQGDDGIYVTRDPDKLMDRFTQFNLSVNEGKSYTSQKFAVFLQNYYSDSYTKDGEHVGIYPVYRAVNRLIFQERWSEFEDYGIEGRDYYAIRAITILENCRHHPMFKDLVEFVVRSDKYGLRFSDGGLKKYVQMLQQSSGSQGLLVNQYGDDVTGIRNFATVKLINQL